jgi:hypothetical protein
VRERGHDTTLTVRIEHKITGAFAAAIKDKYTDGRE